MQLARRRITTAILVFVMIPIFALAGYRYRCVVAACPPADWSTTYTEVTTQLAWLRPDYRIRGIYARPVDGAQIAADGSVDMLMTVEYVSTKAGSAPMGEYAAEQLTFNDRDRWLRWPSYNFTSPQPPNPERQVRFAWVRLTPRDVLKATWPLALRELLEVRTDQIFLAIDASDGLQEEFGVETAWLITYDTDGLAGRILYWVDAQTGQILKQVKYPGSQ